jgi:hypothetical protein
MLWQPWLNTRATSSGVLSLSRLNAGLKERGLRVAKRNDARYC